MAVGCRRSMPNVFIPSVSAEDWKKLKHRRTIPLVSRAVSGFPPGSTFKIITALGGLRKNMGKGAIQCPGPSVMATLLQVLDRGKTRDRTGRWALADALRGLLRLAIERSYQYANQAGIVVRRSNREDARHWGAL